MYAIESAAEQQQEVRVLVELADQFEEHPQSWLHALEVRKEIKRLRPKWLRPVVSKRRIREFLKGHRERWQEAKLGIIPPWSAYELYKRDFERGVAQSRHVQKELRKDVLGRRSDFRLLGPSGAVLPVNGADPEVYWRVECLQVWHNAIEAGTPASRDYADWLGPHLRPGCLRDNSYAEFWLTEVASEAMPLNRLVGLVDFYQLGKKISHGNAVDRLHAGNWLRSDLFVTADRSFYEVLVQVGTHHYPGRPLPVLVERSGASLVSQLEALLRDHRAA
jgi:hypothetical protein